MRHRLRTAAALSAWLLTSSCASAPTTVDTAAAPSPVDAVTLPALPDWTDRYAASNAGDVRFFEIERLMAAHGLTRLEAVELQNHYRDLSRAGTGDPVTWFQTALGRVRAGELESGLDPARLAAAPLIVVFDLDETLFDQYLEPGTTCSDLEVTHAGGRSQRVVLAPGWQETFTRLRDLGAVLVLFTANLDEPSLANLRAWTWEGRPLLGHPDVAGVLTNSHLVRQSKHEGAGRENPRRGQPVTEASKDLRVLDETLTRVVIVDDNPLRLFQPRNAIVPVPFDADPWCRSTDEAFRAARARTLPAIAADLAEALAWARAEGQPFVRGLLPHTEPGRRMIAHLQAAGLTPDAARAFVRAHPELVP